MLGWLVFGAVATVCATASGENKEFRSWYDGWGMHKVWGLGIVKASYAHGFVTCGRAKFKVMPVYDVHSDKRAPSPEQTAASLRTFNVALAGELEKQGLKRRFEEDQRGDASWLGVAERKAP